MIVDVGRKGTLMKNLYGQELDEELLRDLKKLRSRIMYIENKTTGDARIGRVYYSRSGKTIYYSGRRLKTRNGRGFKSNYLDIETGEEYWISGPKKRGGNRLYGGDLGVVIDDDIIDEYKSAQQGDAPEPASPAR